MIPPAPRRLLAVCSKIGGTIVRETAWEQCPMLHLHALLVWGIGGFPFVANTGKGSTSYGPQCRVRQHCRPRVDASRPGLRSASAAAWGAPQQRPCLWVRSTQPLVWVIGTAPKLPRDAVALGLPLCLDALGWAGEG